MYSDQAVICVLREAWGILLSYTGWQFTSEPDHYVTIVSACSEDRDVRFDVMSIEQS